jgi:tRNA(Ile)-lysidine synthase
VSAPAPAAAEFSEPLTAAEFEALLEPFRPFERPPALAVAVSGGPDSLALAFLAQEWAAGQGGTVLALVVDHRLRPESSGEAARVAGWLRVRGVRSRLLIWEGAKPATGIQAAAREARYRLLTTACREAGILHLLLAHHADDQAETVAMRAERGSGPSGLAGMAAVSELPGMRLLRPLLNVPKARLVATLKALGQPWIEDPSNRSPRFRRASLRADAGFDPAPLIEAGRRAALARSLLDRALARFLAAHARLHPLGFVRVDLAAWRTLAEELRTAALARLLPAVGAAPYPPPGETLQRLARTTGAATPGWRATAAGAILEAARSGDLILAREPGRIVHILPLQAGTNALWDRRFVVTCGAVPDGLAVAALGEAGRKTLPPAVRERARNQGLPPAALAALPAVRDGDRLIACLSLAQLSLGQPPELVVEAALAPLQPLAPAAFMGANVVSNPRRLIYPAGTGRDPAAGTAAAGSCSLGA